MGMLLAVGQTRRQPGAEGVGHSPECHRRVHHARRQIHADQVWRAAGNFIQLVETDGYDGDIGDTVVAVTAHRIYASWPELKRVGNLLIKKQVVKTTKLAASIDPNAVLLTSNKTLLFGHL